jgi:hypothetical protein
VADRSSQLLISALTRAAADTAGVPLHGGKTTPGLFPTTALGKQTAQRCCDEGYLQPVHGPARNGRSTPICTITERGLAYLVGSASPRQVLEDLVRIVEEREGQINQLLDMARSAQASLEAIRRTITPFLGRVHAPLGDLKALFAEFRQDKTSSSPIDPTPFILSCLTRWSQAGGQDDCPLPDLYRQLQADCPALTIGQFHDALRQLHASGQVWLHPWTGPMYEVPEPSFALLVGHEIAYYVSSRP